jgi:SAM-dependent methyltransferase
MSDGGTTYSGIGNLEVMAEARNYVRFLNDQISEAAGPPDPLSPLLDFGAGAGTHAREMRGRGYEVDCIEIDPTLMAVLADDGFSVWDATSALGGRSYSTCYTMNVLEHIPDDVAALRGVNSVMDPNGSLVVYVPAFQMLFSAMDTKVGHLRRYRRRQLMAVVEEAGFSISRCVYVDSIGFLAALVFRLVGNDDGELGTRSVSLYDRFLFPVSRVCDVALRRVLGKNLLLVASPNAEMTR